MLIKKFSTILILTLFTTLHSPQLLAEDSAKNIDEVISWWEKYGKYWDKAKKKKKADIASADNQ